MTPIWGVEMDPETMHPKTERVELIYGNWNEVGYERNGEDHCDPPLSDEALEVAYEKFLEAQGGQGDGGEHSRKPEDYDEGIPEQPSLHRGRVDEQA